MYPVYNTYYTHGVEILGRKHPTVCTKQEDTGVCKDTTHYDQVVQVGAGHLDVTEADNNNNNNNNNDNNKKLFMVLEFRRLLKYPREFTSLKVCPIFGHSGILCWSVNSLVSMLSDQISDKVLGSPMCSPFL